VSSKHQARVNTTELLMNIHKLPTDLKSFNFIEDEVRILN
jgi:hypothetical protein